MNDIKTKDYMIDVAQDTTYQNQSDEYKESFAKWRSNPQNSFGFQFIHDTREHSYIDGEGFVPHKAEVAERISMLKCCSLLGVCLVVRLKMVSEQAEKIKLVTKIPNKVVFANSKGYEKMRGTAIVIMMVIIVVGRVGQYILSLLFSAVHVDGIYSILVFSTDPITAVISFAFFAIIVPIIQEILFRGVILQTFRQFGDTFAILITALVNGL